MGVEIIKHNSSLFNEKTALWSILDLRQQYVSYIKMHDGFIDKSWICIVSSLSPSFDTLPDNMQHELQKLIHLIIGWLANLLEEGLKNRIFDFNEKPEAKAYMIHSTLLSSLQMNKVLKNNVYRTIQSELLSI